MYLEKIDAPQDLRGLTTEQLHALADEIREALLRYEADLEDLELEETMTEELE